MARSFCFLQMENGTINGNRRLLFQQTCPSMARPSPFLTHFLEFIRWRRICRISFKDSEIFLRISSSLTFAAAFLDNIKLVCYVVDNDIAKYFFSSEIFPCPGFVNNVKSLVAALGCYKGQVNSDLC
jgi:hypothetical protein